MVEKRRLLNEPLTVARERYPKIGYFGSFQASNFLKKIASIPFISTKFHKTVYFSNNMPKNRY